MVLIPLTPPPRTAESSSLASRPGVPSSPVSWLRRWPLLLLVLAGLASFSAFAAVPDEGIHPLAWMASLLPLQLAALLWALGRKR
ncbi:MAG: hypothetical protein ACOVNL_00985 [Prochlorococcaceae cyanobacterium]|jgi:hypothetical protein